ncbi:MAG: hypothetical protein P4L66_11730 [Acetobacteraceae bacterium]|nr:hypothetical protein [Acetobacteraceae bacterium]
MTLPTEWTLGPFNVDRSGLLSPSTPESFPTFGVRWRNRRLAVRMSRRSEQDAAHGVLEMQVQLGRVPSSAGPDAELRLQALAMAASLPRQGPEDWAFRLLADHVVQIDTCVPIALPVSLISLVSELTQFLLTLDPYLDALDSVGLLPSATALH